MRTLTLLALLAAAGDAGAGALEVAYCGFVGGDDRDMQAGLAVDAAGNAYVAGTTFSSEATFPVTVGPDLTLNDFGDAFVAKVSSDGRGLVYAGYIGGDSSDQARAVAVDVAGSAYVTGLTKSDQSTFPVRLGPDLTHNSAGPISVYYDAYVAKVRPDGTSLVYCGYIGGAGHDEGNSVFVDTTGRAYVAGETTSSETSLPVLVGPDLTFNYGGTDFYVARVKSDGSGFEYCGYIGGDDSDFEPRGIAADDSGRAYVTSPSWSSEATFPVTVGPDLTYGGNGDGSIARVRADGSGLEYAGYIGGTEGDNLEAVAVDATGGAFVAGFTSSTEATFPVTSGPDLTHNGASDAFVARVTPDGAGLSFAGYIGGAGSDNAFDLAIDVGGTIHVAGRTGSPETSFPVSGGPDSTYNGGDADAFVASVLADGTGLIRAGYIGGAGTDRGYRIGIDEAGATYVAGDTDSTEATFPVVVGPDFTWNGGPPDAFVAKLVESACAAAPQVVRALLAVKSLLSRDDVAMSWQADLGANGYNVWYVEEERLIDVARQSGSPPAAGVPGCTVPSPAPGPTCVDFGAVPRGSPAVFFYQVRAFCDAASEGP